jgi:hypothetical protein
VQQRIVRALLWGVVAGGGLALGLAAGSSLAATPVDREMLAQLGGGAAGLAAVVGFCMPAGGRRET